MDNGEFDDDDIPDDFDEIDYMLSEEWSTDIDSKSSIIYFKELLGGIKNLNQGLYMSIVNSISQNDFSKLENIMMDAK